MANGEGSGDRSPIIAAIAKAEQGTTGEIRVHLSRRLYEPDAFKHASKLFGDLEKTRIPKEGAVLLYLNLRKHKAAVVADLAIHEAAGPRYWERLMRELSIDLRSTHPENAIAIAVRKIGEKLRENYPTELAGFDGPS